MGDSAVEGMKHWIKVVGPFWAASIAGHLVVFIMMALVLGTVHVAQKIMEAPEFEAEVETALPEPELNRFEVGETPIEPTVLDTESLTQLEAPKMEQTEKVYDDNPQFVEAGGGMSNAASNFGGLGGFSINALGAGPAVRGPGGVGSGAGTSNSGGSGGDGQGFGGRGQGQRQAMVGGFGGTKNTERAVAAALNWIARHQSNEGNWSIAQYAAGCKDDSCTGAGKVTSDTAATAMALLPFLAAGQTHTVKGPYQKSIYNGLMWMVNNQKPDGSLISGGGNMYSHGLSAICMCEAYGLTKDPKIGHAAQAAIKFIETAQNTEDGGWRYTPGQPGDTSVVGWQVMAMKSALMSGLQVDPKTMDGAHKFLKLASAKSKNGGGFSYTPDSAPNISMTSVGLLCSQYMGVKRSDPPMIEGLGMLMKAMPTSKSGRNLYYWYYGTQVMHNLPGPEWDAWNRNMRRLLIESQVKEGCATGSWDPLKPVADAWGDAGGRLMITSLSTLTLEVYYRYLPLYKLDNAGAAGAEVAKAELNVDTKPAAKTDAKPAAKADAKPAEKAAK
jgi:hypothetical protein